MNKIRKNFCARPFMLCNITPNGNFSPCCRIPDGFGSIKKQSLESLWNSETMIDLRKCFIKDERSELCNDCWQLEDRDLLSERLSSGNQFLTDEFEKEILRDHFDGHVPTFQSLEIRPSNLCNFTCRMCHPSVSSAWHPLNANVRLYSERSEKYIKAYEHSVDMVRDIKPFLPSLKYIKIHGGEPMFEPQVIEILQLIQPYKGHIWLRWITNLSIVDHPFYNTDILKGWRKLSTTVSLDGPPSVSEYIRRGQNIRSFEKNLSQLQKLDTDIFFHISLQALNVLRIPEFIDYALTLNPYRITCNKVTHPSALSTQVLPAQLKRAALERLEEYVARFSQLKMSQRLRADIQIVIDETQKLLLEEPLPTSADLWRDFLNWNFTIDKSYEKLLNLYPELQSSIFDIKSHAVL